MEDTSRFSLLEDGRVLDFLPEASGKPALVFAGNSWVTFTGKGAEVTDSKPITAAEAARLTSGATCSQDSR